jgi:hypothetical protein
MTPPEFTSPVPKVEHPGVAPLAMLFIHRMQSMLAFGKMKRLVYAVLAELRWSTRSAFAVCA